MGTWPARGYFDGGDIPAVFEAGLFGFAAECNLADLHLVTEGHQLKAGCGEAFAAIAGAAPAAAAPAAAA